MSSPGSESVNPLAQGITLVVPELEAAQRAYDAHCARCPGSHFDVYGHPELERARQLWVEEKFHLAERLEVAKAFAQSGWTRGNGKLAAPAAPKSRQERIPKKPIRELVNCYRDKLATLAREAPRSPKWISARNQAYGYAYAIRERCREERVDMPALDPVPTMPPKEGPRKPMPLKAATGDPRRDERRRKDRERKRRAGKKGETHVSG